MYNMCPYNCYHCPYLLGRWIQTRQCMSKAQMFAIAQKAQIVETYNITFNPNLAAKFNGVYQITAVAGDPNNFILLTIKSNGQEFQFKSNQLCSITLKGLTKPIQTPVGPKPKCMSKADLFTITQAANPDATYTIYFNPEFAATYDGVYKIYGSSGDYTYFVLFVQNLNGLNLQFNSDQICAIK